MRSCLHTSYVLTVARMATERAAAVERGRPPRLSVPGGR